MVKRSGWLAALLLFAATAVSCSSMGPPAETISAAELSLRKAEEVQASRYAPLDLVQAREKLEQAEVASDRKQFAEARRLAEQALVDAQLAEEKARTARANETALEMRRSLDTLRSETERYSPRPPAAPEEGLR